MFKIYKLYWLFGCLCLKSTTFVAEKRFYKIILLRL